MPKRSITDAEIGLIKAMLARGMKNRDIQFYFNRQDRPVNSGRITQIRGGSYGPEASQAPEAELDAFLSGFAPSAVGAVVGGHNAAPQSLADRARLMFEQRGRAGWFLISHESETTECKETFCLKPENRFADPLRSIAGLANNIGGFVFFGIDELPDGSLSVVGMRDDAFAQMDPSELNRCLAGALDPVPTFITCLLDFEGKTVGAIYVEKHDHPPVMAIKNVSTEVREGTIYYRYVGETRAIKPGELRQIIAYREQKAVAEFARSMSKVAIGSAATLDLDSGKVEGKTGSFVIDEALLPKLQFIREGEFDEAKGAPALRLIGDVAPVGSGPTKTVWENVTDEAVLVTILRQEEVTEPMQYVLHSAHTGRGWLPLFYYAKATKRPLAEVAETLSAATATHATKRDAAVRRLTGAAGGAFQKAIGRAKAILEDALAGTLATPVKQSEVAPMGLAIQGLPASATVDFAKLRGALLAAYELTRGNTPQQKALRSTVYRAACRLDELEFGPSSATRPR